MADTKSTWESIGGNNADKIGGNANRFTYTDENGKTSVIQVDNGTQFSSPGETGYNNFMPEIMDADAYLITHCHMDHIGAWTHQLNIQRDELKKRNEEGKPLTIHCPKFAQCLLEDNLTMNKIPREEFPKFVTVEPNKPFEVAGFKVEPFAVSHSSPDAIGYVIESPDGVRMMTCGDFKTAEIPMGKGWNEEEIAKMSAKGIDLMFLDSTSATQDGVCPAEKEVINGIKEVLPPSEGGMIVSAIIASSAHRLHTVATAVAEYANETGSQPRTIVLDGGSLTRSARALKRCGYSIENMIKETTGQKVSIVDARDEKALAKVPKSQRFYVCTGTQGEELASFSRASRGENRNIPMHGGTPIFVYNLQSCIPGNEETYAAMEQGFKDQGCTTFFPDRYKENKYLTHVSGHAKGGDIKSACELVAKHSPRPTTVVPVHGDPAQRKAVMKIAQDAGMKAAIVPNFAAVEVSKEGKVSFTKSDAKEESWIAVKEVEAKNGQNKGNRGRPETEFEYYRVARNIETGKLREVEEIEYTKAVVEERGFGGKGGKKGKNKGNKGFNPAFSQKGGRGR